MAERTHAPEHEEGPGGEQVAELQAAVRGRGIVVRPAIVMPPELADEIAAYTADATPVAEQVEALLERWPGICDRYDRWRDANGLEEDDELNRANDVTGLTAAHEVLHVRVANAIEKAG